MSYSYIKTVFPDFNKTSNKIYDDSLYDINIKENKIIENKTQEIPKTINNVQNKEFELPLNNLLESYQNTTLPYTYTSNEIYNSNQNKNNLQFYNLPINKEYLKPESVQSNISSINSINSINSIKPQSDKTNLSGCNTDCDIYMKHMLECSTCKDIFIKQNDLENEKIRNEEILEMISYFIFALFILLLVDALKK